MESYSGWTQVLIEGVITPKIFRYPRKSLIVAIRLLDHPGGQPQRDPRPHHAYEQQYQHDQVKRNRPHHNITQLAAPHSLHDIKVDPNRWRDLPQFYEHDENDSEPDWID